MSISTILLALLVVFGLVYGAAWAGAMLKQRAFAFPKPLELGIGFVTDFFDTLGIGSFAVTTSMFKFWRVAPDETIPGTLNVGHTIPTIVEALIFIAIVHVDPLTLVALIVAAIVGAWLGAGVVARWPRRYVQIGMGAALLAAAVLFLIANLQDALHVKFFASGTALGLHGTLLWLGIIINFCLGALMTLGIGLYAPAMISVSLLGMSSLAAFPIMMGSCAFLMPIASWRFIRFDRYTLRAALGLTIGGVPGVLLAAFIVKSLPLQDVRWLVIAVVLYAATSMLRSAAIERRTQAGAPAPAA